MKERRRGKQYGRFLKMIDNLQTPKHKTNHKYRSRFPLTIFFQITGHSGICTDL